QAIPGHKALVFSQFTSYLKLIKEALEEAGIKTVYLDGSTRRRDQVVKEFSEGDAQAFLISLRAGGTGLTLTAADYVFVMDPWWNPAVEEQAIDRAHRIGQERPVNVYRLVATGTIEEKVSQLQQCKRDLFSSVVPASSSITDLANALLLDSEQLVSSIS
ncbi:C-terminal helicase domain-containing protein, partial [Varibaculum cambriense]